MDPAASLRDGQVDEALAAVQEQVRARPGDAGLRTSLFELLGVVGQWERALQQLEVLEGLGPDPLLFARSHQPVIQSELVRRDVFAGQRSPVIFGEPERWMSLLVEANQLRARREFVGAQELREKALAEAPASAGTVDGVACTWLADADARLGPVLELILEGRYCWVPLIRIRQLEIVAPKNLRDLLWVPVRVVWTNEGEAAGVVPVRYPGTEAIPDGPLRLARRTEWRDEPGDLSVGLGQRLLATDEGDYPLLEVRRIELNGTP